MQQIMQSFKNGETKIEQVPVPKPAKGRLLIQTTRTLLSPGTERMLIEFGKAGWINKARQQPDKVRMVLDKVKTDGLQPTIDAVFNKLDKPIPLGYCNVGVVSQAGSGVTGFEKGDRVISNGYHAEVVNVPINLCVKVPQQVTDEEAAFTVLGAISLQGVRLSQATLGETVVVTGLGLIGLITVQLLKAQGCRVLGIDYDTDKLALAEKFGAEVVNLSIKQDPLTIAESFSRHRGVDAVIITASTPSSEPVHQAAQMCRKRGRIVLVGVTGLELSRDDFYEKELTFQVSASYGPGRYDASYEENGQDYPVGFVRWTAQRNFEAVLDMMAEGRLDVTPLITHRFDIDNAEKAYEIITNKEPSLAIMLAYPGSLIGEESKSVNLIPLDKNKQSFNKIDSPKVSFIGSGNYATSVLIPVFKIANSYLYNVTSNSGISGVHAGKKFGFDKTSTDAFSSINDEEADIVVITTRHNSHSELVIEALKAGKHVFVEKPLCLSLQQLNNIEEVYSQSLKVDLNNNPVVPHLMVGFNRRFSPHIQKMKDLLRSVKSPKAINYTVNSGSISSDHWTQDPEIGGGRIIGEACHFIDLIRYLIGAPITCYELVRMDSASNDTAGIQLKFADGSVGNIQYFSNGSKSFPKERLEVFSEGRVLQLDNFRRLIGYGWPGFKKMNLWRQDKGQLLCVKAFLDSIKEGKPPPISLQEIFEVSRITIELANKS